MPTFSNPLKLRFVCNPSGAVIGWRLFVNGQRKWEMLGLNRRTSISHFQSFLEEEGERLLEEARADHTTFLGDRARAEADEGEW